jgi:hypothetical protein
LWLGVAASTGNAMPGGHVVATPAELVTPNERQAAFLGWLRRDPAVRRFEIIRLDAPALLAAESLKLVLPGGPVLHLARERVESGVAGSVWIGRDDAARSAARMVMRELDVAGTVDCCARRLAIRPLGSGLHVVVEWNLEALRDEEPWRWGPGAPPPAVPVRPLPAAEPDPCPEVSLLIAFTRAAEDRAGGTPTALRVVIDGAVDATNVALGNSDVAWQLVLVPPLRIEPYEECCLEVSDSGQVDCTPMQQDLKRLMDAGDPDLGVVHRYRDVYAADIVVLLTGYAECAGKSAGVFAHEGTAFAVVNQIHAASNRSLAHEIGHMFGARHANDNSTLPFAHGHGFCVGSSYRTVMAISDDCCRSALRIGHFSNPGVYYSPPGEAQVLITGSAGWSDNARVLRERACAVAGFRTKGGLVVAPTSIRVRAGRAAALSVEVTRSGAPADGAPVLTTTRDPFVAVAQRWVTANADGRAKIALVGATRGETTITVRAEGVAVEVSVKVTGSMPWWAAGSLAALAALLAAWGFGAWYRRRERRGWR